MKTPKAAFAHAAVTWCAVITAIFYGSVGTARAQVSYNWSAAAGGNWNAAGNWSPSGGPPGAADSATISSAVTPGTYTVTLNDARSITNVTLNNATATLAQSGDILTLSGTMTLAAGTYTFSGATISGGSIVSTGASMSLGASTGNIFSNVSIGAGVLNFGTSDSSARLQGTSSLASGTTLTINGGFNGLAFEQSATTNNLTLNITSSGNSIGVPAGDTIIFGAGSTVNHSAPSGSGSTLGQDFATGTIGTIQNAGLIENTAGGALTISPAAFANLSGGNVEATLGTILISVGGTINQSGGNFTINGGTLTLSGASWVNAGTMTLSTGTLNLGGSYATAGIGTITRTGGTVNITGALNNASATLALTAATGTYVLNNGSITGGSLTASGGAVLEIAGNGSANRLNNVAIGLNALDFSTSGGRVTIQGTSTIASGTTFTLSGGNTLLAFFQTGGSTVSLSSTTINFTNAANVALDGNVNVTMDAASSITNNTAGTTTVSSLSGLNGLANGTGTFTSNGLIQNNTQSSLLVIEPAVFTNNGTIQATNGQTRIVLSAGGFTTNFTNIDPGTTLSGGTYIVSAANSSIFTTLDFQTRSVATIATGTTVTLNGVNTTFNSLNALTANNGTFSVLGGRNFTPTAAAISNSGSLTIGLMAGDGSKFTGAITNTAGTLIGTGAITGAITLNGGTLAPGNASNVGTLTTNAEPTFAGGTFSINLNTLSSFGQLSVTPTGTLNLGAGNPVSLTVTPYNGATDGTFPIILTGAGSSVTNFFSNFPTDHMTVFTDSTTGSLYRIYYGSYPGQSGNVVISGINPVPEPAHVILACTIAAGLFGWRRRKT
jgi:hypothetical protein